MTKSYSLHLKPQELKNIILSHGWYALKPIYASTSPLYLEIPFNTPHGIGIVEITAQKDICTYKIKAGEKNACDYVLNTCLSLDFDTTAFNNEIKNNPDWSWIATRRMGRFLKSSTLFEDCCKAIFSTNTTFDRTINMTKALVDLYGIAVQGKKVFPGPKQLYKRSEKTIRQNLCCGYRAKYILDLCKSALNKPDFFGGDFWKELSNFQFYSELKEVKGLGPVSLNYLSSDLL
jgi:3-methyladenine DNA glycosylase/8-oxoguanine DNA glycosylase